MRELGTSETPQRDLPLSSFIQIYKGLGIDRNNEHEISTYRRQIHTHANVSNTTLKLLEVGSGTARISHLLASIPGIALYEGIDTHPEYVAYAQNEYPWLSFTERNFFSIPVEEQWDVVCIPYTLINMFSFSRQEILIRKAIAHAKLVLLDTILPDTHGVKEDTELSVGKKEFQGIDLEIIAHYFCKASIEKIARSAGATHVSFTNYPFIKKRKITEHTIVCCAR